MDNNNWLVKGAETTMTALAFVCFDGIGSSVGGWSAGQLYKSGFDLSIYLLTVPAFACFDGIGSSVGGWSAGQL